MANIPIMALVAVLVPLGCRHDPAILILICAILTKGGPLLIPFMMGINLEMLLQGGLAGILLGVLTTFVGGFFCNIAQIARLAELVLPGRRPPAPRGGAVATPLAIAQADPSLAEVVAAAVR